MKIYIFSILLAFISSYVHAYTCEGTDQEWTPEHYRNSDTHTIEGPYSAEQVEKKHSYFPAGKTESVPFGASNEKWERFKEIYEPGDQLYYIKIEHGKNSLEKYIIVRDKCVMGRFLLSSRGMID